ncbi:hypothetical protein ACQKL5_18090 [Peribacillus sp. NPDC097675]|uniref:hypothetical protein n=1 Tax=Peribacillus sp. NPDC097675 TaxID=3390618 RepID=UPI003D06E5A7
MNFEMQMARMLAENIDGFVKFVYKQYEDKDNCFTLNHDKLYQLKLLIEEYKFQMIADELQRINRFTWDEKYTYLLVGRFREGMAIIDEYVEHNYHDLFIFTARIYTLNTFSFSIDRKEPLKTEESPG